MKNIILSSISMLLLFVFMPSMQAQKAKKKIQKETFSVVGVCGMCEKRIEKAALIKGVKSVQWAKDQQTITVLYKTKKVSLTEIKQAIASAGHDTDEVKAAEEAYGELPQCCAYRDGVEVH